MLDYNMVMVIIFITQAVEYQIINILELYEFISIKYDGIETNFMYAQMLQLLASGVLTQLMQEEAGYLFVSYVIIQAISKVCVARYMKKHRVYTSIIGKTGEALNNIEIGGIGKVMIDDEQWDAVQNTKINSGEQCEVLDTCLMEDDQGNQYKVLDVMPIIARS